MKVGLVIGKFYPPHEGHHSVIDRALAECDQVIVGILWSECESISPLDRVQWLEDAHPHAEIYAVRDEHKVDYDSDIAWRNHLEVINNAIPWGVTHVYGSEKYIIRLARELGAEPVIVDITRRKHPVSGTAIRNNPQRYWSHLRPATRAGLTKRIVLVGAESCGTTTLTKELARTHSTVWVPEYGRTYSEGLDTGHSAWTHSDLVHIAKAQKSFEDEMARHTKKGLLFCDTNALATRIWEEFLVGPSEIRDTPADLYILTGLCPWEDDGIRSMQDRREAMQDRFKQVLGNQSVPWIEVNGGREARLSVATRAIHQHCHWEFAPPLG